MDAIRGIESGSDSKFDGEVGDDADTGDAQADGDTDADVEDVSGGDVQPGTGGPDADGHDSTADEDAGPLLNTTTAFDVLTDLQQFIFMTPEPVITAPGSWGYGVDPQPHLIQSAAVHSGTAQAPTGTRAIHKRAWVADGSVSVDYWSSDDDSVGLIARYVDATHYYRGWITVAPGTVAPLGPRWFIQKHDGNTIHQLASAVDGGIQSHSFPGHRLTFTVVGATLSLYQDGRLLGSIVDSSYSEGGTGIYTRALHDAHFDNFEVAASAVN